MALDAELLAQVGGGLYRLVPSVLVAFICGLVNVWVLLVGILGWIVDLGTMGRS